MMTNQQERKTEMNEMTFATFTTASDAIEAISAAIEAGEASAGDYDLDKILDAAFDYWPALGRIQHAGYVQTGDEDEFWEIVEANRLDRERGDR